MRLFSKVFGAPVKQWEREYVNRGATRKAKSSPNVKPPEPEPEFVEEQEPGFFSRLMEPALKPWEREYAGQGTAPKLQHNSLDAEFEPLPPNATKLQHALRAIAQENRDVPDLFRKKVASAAPAPKSKDAPRRPGRHVRTASLPEIDGAITSAIAAVGSSSPEYFNDIVTAARDRLQGKAVEAKILNERVKAKLA